MIRINLLASERRAAPTTGRSFQAAQKITVLGSLLLIIVALLVGWRYWALGQEEEQLVRDIEAARREESRLSQVLKDVTDFEAQRGQLQQRVTLIDELRKGQNAPVHMIDQISRAMPDMTWLTTLKQSGYDVTIEGRALTLTALTDFVSNLQSSGYFVRPVEIVDSQVIPGETDGPELIRFTIRATFQMAGIETVPGGKPPVRGGKVG